MEQPASMRHDDEGPMNDSDALLPGHIQRANIWRLAIAQALAGANAVAVYAAGAIIGSQLAPSPMLATLPISVFVVGMAVCILPAGAIARRHGRRAAFLAAWPGVRRRVLRAEQMLLGIVALAADEVTVVVAAAVVHDGRLLVARRTRPAALAGRWELPGGKADPGESEPAALRRELAEELGLAVDVGERIGPDVELGDGLVLRCRLARPVDPAVPLRPTEHDRVRWVPAADLDGLDWLDADRALLPQLRVALDPAGRAPLGHD